MDNMTVISKDMFVQAQIPMSVSDAVQILQKNGNFRTLGEIIRSFAPCGDPEEVIIQGLIRNDPKHLTDPKAVKEAKTKRVRNWFSGKVMSIGKLDAFEVCQILGLSLQQTDDFIMLVTGEAIHWRDPEEIIWGYAISNGLSYERTLALLKKAEELTKAGKAVDLPNSYTDSVKNEIFSASMSEEELLLYLEKEQERLGKLHNTAYQVFQEYMDLLGNGEADDLMEDSSPMSVRDIVENYMYRRLVPMNKQKRRDGQNADNSKKIFASVQKGIRMNWPDETTLSKMSKRKMDIPRKALILLFLATDTGEPEYGEFEDDEEELTRDEVFQTVYTRLNQMLNRCGFRMLDPRNPFDWLVLFCICVDDIWETDKRMAQMLQALFSEENEIQN